MSKKKRTRFPWGRLGYSPVGSRKTYIWYKAVQDSYLRLYVSNKKFSCQGNQIQSNHKLRFQLLLLLEIPIIIILFKFTFIKNTLHTCHIINPCLQSSLQLIEAERKIKKSCNKIYEHQHIKLTRQKIHIFQNS